jgi:penicillin V acylase-like amidase (Ntn superfamily)
VAIQPRFLAAILGVCCLASGSSTTPPKQPGEPRSDLEMQACSSVCLDDDGSPVFGANMDHVTIDAGYLYVNPRGLQKTGLDPGSGGRLASWVSRYASVTFNLVGYEYAWAGMNERGLSISTMALGPMSHPTPDGRPPLDSGRWMQ